jgi:hypothetical protein
MSATCSLVKWQNSHVVLSPIFFPTVAQLGTASLNCKAVSKELLTNFTKLSILDATLD